MLPFLYGLLVSFHGAVMYKNRSYLDLSGTGSFQKDASAVSFAEVSKKWSGFLFPLTRSQKNKGKNCLMYSQLCPVAY